MNIFGTITAGGQTWAHRVRMFRQVFRIAIVSSLSIGIFVFIIMIFQMPSICQKSIWYTVKAKSVGKFSEKINVDSAFWYKISRESFSGSSASVSPEKVLIYSKKYNKMGLAYIGYSIKKMINWIINSLFFIIAFFLVKGYLARKNKHISGKKIIPSWQLKLLLKLKRKASDITLGSLPMIKGSESQHILISGGTGSGKTNCFHHILPQIRKAGQRAVIVDTTGAFVERYYREGKDYILNPFDERSEKWHPWAECEDRFDFDALAESFIPISYSESESYWRNAARSVFSSLLQVEENTKKTSDLKQLLLYDSITKLHHSLKGTKAAAHIDPSLERTSGSIRSVISSFLDCLEFLPDTKNAFSIRKWVQEKDEDDSWLFLYSSVAQRASMNPLLSAWFSSSMRGLLQMPINIDRRLWFVADELASLNRLKDLETCLTESRKFGGCALLAIQSPAQLEHIYGSQLAKIIIGNCSTRVVLSEQDPEIAQLISKGFGDREIQESHEGLSYGAHQMRDGVNLSMQSKTRPVVSASDIQSLEKLEAFIKLPGKHPITKQKFRVIKS